MGRQQPGHVEQNLPRQPRTKGIFLPLTSHRNSPKPGSEITIIQRASLVGNVPVTSHAARRSLACKATQGRRARFCSAQRTSNQAGAPEIKSSGHVSTLTVQPTSSQHQANPALTVKEEATVTDFSKNLCSVSQQKPNSCIFLTLELQHDEHGADDLQKSLAAYIFLRFYSRNRNKPGLTELTFYILSRNPFTY